MPRQDTMTDEDTSTGFLFSVWCQTGLGSPANSVLPGLYWEDESGRNMDPRPRWPHLAGQVGGEAKLFPGCDYAASLSADTAAGTCPTSGDRLL